MLWIVCSTMGATPPTEFIINMDFIVNSIFYFFCFTSSEKIFITNVRWFIFSNLLTPSKAICTTFIRNLCLFFWLFHQSRILLLWFLKVLTRRKWRFIIGFSIIIHRIRWVPTISFTLSCSPCRCYSRDWRRIVSAQFFLCIIGFLVTEQIFLLLSLSKQ